MLRKVVLYIGLTLLVALFAAYFIFADTLREAGKVNEICTSIKVEILDSLENRFVSKREVKDILLESPIKPIGANINDLNLYQAEELLNGRSAIKKSSASVSRDGVLHVAVTQRKPILRIQTQYGGFYIDDQEYIFPLVDSFTSYVPIVTGEVPINLTTGYRGAVSEEEKEWVSSIIAFGNYISKNEFWSAQIQQIEVEPNGDVTLYTRVGDIAIKFGPLKNIEYKFTKLTTFYNNIIPVEGWEKYSEISLKYSNQIVCKPKKRNKEINTIKI